MKLMTKAALVLLALGTSAAFIIAQDNNNNNAPPNGSQSQNGPPAGGPGMRRHRPPPIIAALDANHDGVIDETEIANASAALKTLDKNGDGKLTMDELMGPRPMGGGGPGAPRPDHGDRGDQRLRHPGPARRPDHPGPGGQVAG